MGHWLFCVQTTCFIAKHLIDKCIILAWHISGLARFEYRTQANEQSRLDGAVLSEMEEAQLCRGIAAAFSMRLGWGEDSPVGPQIAMRFGLKFMRM